MNRSYIINDVNGNPINEKYPPNKEIYGDEFGGYKSEAEKILFHDFAVLSSDFYIFYNDTFYSVNKEADSIKVSWNAFLSDSKVVYNEEEYRVKYTNSKKLISYIELTLLIFENRIQI